MLIFSMAQPPLRPQDAVMLIPSLEPDDRLPAYVRRLLDKGFQHVVIVDDGSSAAYQPIFAELDAMAPDHPLFLRHISGHLALCTTS